MGCTSSVVNPETTVLAPEPRPRSNQDHGVGAKSEQDAHVPHKSTNPSPRSGPNETVTEDQAQNTSTPTSFRSSGAYSENVKDDLIKADGPSKADGKIKDNDHGTDSTSRELRIDIPVRSSPEGASENSPVLEARKDETHRETDEHNDRDEGDKNTIPAASSDVQDRPTKEEEYRTSETETKQNANNTDNPDHGGSPLSDPVTVISPVTVTDPVAVTDPVTVTVKESMKGSVSGESQAKTRRKEVHLKRSENEDLEEVKKKLLCGDIRVQCPQSVKVVRVFLSSTFTDTKQERNQLLERSYPKLKEVCKKRGYEFQLVDMRWGVGQGIANDHMTSEMCFKEIGLCQKLSTGPNFVTLLSHKYGYYAYPRQIEAGQFEQLINSLDSEDDRAFMKERWFVLDTNAQPPHYILKPISTHYPDFLSSDFKIFNDTRKKWNKEADRLIEILIQSARCVFDEEEATNFIKGVTDREIELGILNNPRRNETCLWLKREIDHLDKDHKHISWFADTLKDSDWDRRNAQLLAHLKRNLEACLPETNFQVFNVNWTEQEIDPMVIQEHREYIDKLCTEFETRVEDMFHKAADAQEAQGLGDRLLEELAHHTDLAQTKCKDFYGRENDMKLIKNYLLDTDKKKPLILYGTSGSGKSTVVAMTMRETWEWREGKVAIVTRFIGSSPESSRVGSVLTSMTKQIQQIYQPKPSSFQGEKFTSFGQACEDFSASLKLATEERPLVVLIDSFEQLDPLEEAMNLAWIPLPLPDNVKVIISTLDEETLISRLQPMKHELRGFSQDDAMNTLRQWLYQENRCLTDSQLSQVHSAFTQCSIPLYIRLAFQETLRWKSFSPADETRLKGTVTEAIRAFFMRTEQNHGRVFTSHTLGYLTLARRGLSETEMEDILSCDDDVLTEVFAFWVPPIRRLPPLILVRLRNDLDLYIAQRETDRIPVMLWNHQLFKDVACEMYCSDEMDTKLIHNNLADFFSGTWSGCKKDFTDKDGQLKSEDRQVVDQPIRHGMQANLRKLNNLPWHLAQLGSSDRLKKECLFNMEFLTVKMKSSGIRSVIDDFTDAIDCFPEEGKLFQTIKQAIQISQKAILRDVRELPTQMMNRLMMKSKSDNDLGVLLNNCQRVPFPVLVCDQQLLTPPGGSLQHSLPSHHGKVLSLDIADDGNTAVTCGEDKKIMVWDVSAGNLKFSFDVGANLSIPGIQQAEEPVKDEPITEEPIKALLAYNDQSIVTVTNQSISTFCTDTGKLFKKIFFHDLHIDVPAVCVAGKSKDKETQTRITKANVAVVTNARIHIFAARKLGGHRQKDWAELIKGRIGKLSHCVGHQNYIAVTDEDRYFIRVFQLKDMKATAVRRIYPAFNISGGDNYIGPTIDGICFSVSGQNLFVSNWREGDILCLDTEDLKETSRLPGVCEDQPINFRVTKEEGTLYFPSEKNVVIRDHVNHERTCLAEHPCRVLFCATVNFNPLVTVGDDDILRLWNFDRIKLAWPERKTKNAEPDNMIRSLQLFRTNPRYALALKVATDRSREVIVQDLLERKVVRRANIKCNLEMEVYEEEPANVNAVIRRPSGKLCILDLVQMKVTDRLNISTPEPRSPEKRSFSLLRKRQELLAIGKGNDSVNIYDMKTSRIIDDIYCENREDIENYQVNNRETVLAIATEDCSCIIYNLENKQRLSILTPNDILPEDPECFFFKVICVSSDGKYVVLETDTLIKIWNTQMKGKLSSDLDIYLDTEEFTEIGESVCISGNKLLTSAADGTTRVFEIKSGKTLLENKFHHKEARLSASQSNTYLTYGNDAQDQTIAVWSLNENDPVATFTSDQELDHVTLSHDGKYVVGCLRNPAQIVTWHVQDGTISREKCMNGQQLFQYAKLDIDLNLEEEEWEEKGGFSTEDDLDSPGEGAEDLDDTYGDKKKFQ